MARSSDISIIEEPPQPHDFDKHIDADIDIKEVWPYVDLRALYHKYLRIEENMVELLLGRDFDALKDLPDGEKAIASFDMVEEAKEKYDNDFLRPKLIYQFFKCQSTGNKIEIISETSTDPVMLEFPRNKKGICLSDYIAPSDSEITDSIACFITTSGGPAKEFLLDLRENGEGAESLIITSLAQAIAEGCAEYIHSSIREAWNISVEAGGRIAFGDSACCPELTNQEPLFSLLDAEIIGVSLTENLMSDPLSSVSGVIIHHEEYNVKKT